MSARLRTPRLLVAFGGLSYLLFPIPIITLFWKDQIGLTLTEIMLLQAIFGSASVLLEFPSGYLADRVGYRTSLVVGVSLWTVGWVFYAIGDTFGGIALAEIILGAGHAFVSRDSRRRHTTPYRCNSDHACASSAASCDAVDSPIA